MLFPEDLPPEQAGLPLDPAGTGFRPAGASLASAVEPSDEADDIVRFGLLGDFVATYRGTGGEWISFEATAFADAEGARGYLADWQADLARAANGAAADLRSFSAAPDPTEVDEAVLATYRLVGSEAGQPERSAAVRVVRAGATLAWVWVVAEDPAAQARSLGALVEMRLRSALAGEIPPRDYSVLGLAPAPTESFTSFAFSYSYGIESAYTPGTFRVEVSGEYRSPDSLRCDRTLIAGGEEGAVSRLVAVGTRVWLAGAGAFQEVPLRHPAALADLPFCPGHALFWEDTGFHRLPAVDGVAGTLEGIAVTRADLVGDEATLAALGYSTEEASRLQRFAVTRSAAGVVLEVDVEEETDLAAARTLFGLEALPVGETPAVVFRRLQLTRLDDPAIHVTPPLLAG